MRDKIVTEKRYRLAALHTHPIQYFGPFYRELSEEDEIELTVYYCSPKGAEEYVDPEFKRRFKWDIPLLEGYRYKYLKNYSPFPSINRFWGLINPAITRELLKERYDAIVIYGYAIFTYLLAYITALFINTPVLFRGDVVLRPEKPWAVRFIKDIALKLLFRKTNVFFTIGRRSKEFYNRYGIASERMFFIPYAVDNESIMNICEREKKKKAEHKEKLQLPKDLPVALFCGKLVERKRPRDILNAFRALDSRAALIFVGDGPLRSTLEKDAKGLMNVRFLGFKNQSEVPIYYAISDMFVVPSSHKEAWGLVINEAMCCKLPIVASDAIPSTADLIKHGENGFIYPVGDVKALTSYMEELLRNPARREDMGRRSLDIISSWNYKKCTEGVLNALRYIKRRKTRNEKEKTHPIW